MGDRLPGYLFSYGDFYQQVVNGVPMDEALRKAKIMMLQGEDQMQTLPYFWGGSIVLGNVQPLLVEKSWTNSLYYRIVGMVILLAVVVYWVKLGRANRSSSHS